MSRTDKTRPFRVKQDELRETDPYGFRRDLFQRLWRPEFRCGGPCCSRDELDRRKRRRDGRTECRNWMETL